MLSFEYVQVEILIPQMTKLRECTKSLLLALS